MNNKVQTQWEMIGGEAGEHHLPGIYHPLIEKILIERGINDPDQMSEFLSEKPQLTHNPYLMKGMREAVDRIIQAIGKDQKIVIYGDYDVDGITSVALLIDFLFSVTDHIDFYIPLRTDGYGINREALLEIREDYQADLLITVDCGISAIEELAYAREISLDVIVTDHHLPGDQLPDAITINPKQPGCTYPFKELCGCAVAFKLAQALQQKCRLPKKQLNKLLDLVALATICDVVPLKNENRTFVKYGLERIEKRERLGLQTLLSLLSLDKTKIDVRHLGFVIGPHFNASGRIDDAVKGVQLLVTRNHETASSIARHLIKLNNERKLIQEAGLDICRQIAAETDDQTKFLLIHADSLHEGVIGIIAGRLRDAYYRPTIVLTPSQDPDIYTGSGRSIQGFHLFNELKPATSLMERFGGHANACGLKIRKENIEKLRKYLQERVLILEKQNPDLLQKKIKIVEEVSPLDITEEAVQEIKKLEPYGMGNEKPYFVMKNLTADDRKIVRMGDTGQHLKVCGFFKDDDQDGAGIEILGFSIEEETKEMILSCTPFDLVFYPQINKFRGKSCVQLMIKDVKYTNSLDQTMIGD
jgi:single-stranded-DNA-specific exonuclease